MKLLPEYTLHVEGIPYRIYESTTSDLDKVEDCSVKNKFTSLVDNQSLFFKGGYCIARSHTCVFSKLNQTCLFDNEIFREDSEIEM